MISLKLESHISSLVQKEPKEIDITSYLNRFALEAVGRGGLGYSFGKLSEPNKFSQAAKDLA